MQTTCASLFALLVIVVSLLTAGAAARKMAMNPRADGYTLSERFGADPWDATVIAAAVLTIIPPVILLSNVLLPRKLITALVHNRVSAALLLALSLLALLAIPAIHIFANLTAYDEFTTTFNAKSAPVAALAPAATAFLSLMQSGPLANATALSASSTVRGASDVGLVNPKNGASLAGGWVTGPGNAKVTLPIATAMCDLAYAALAFRAEVSTLGVIEPVIAQLTQGAEYLEAAYNAADGSLVSHVYDGALSESAGEWARPEQVNVRQRQVKHVVGRGPGTEVYALGAQPCRMLVGTLLQLRRKLRRHLSVRPC